MLSRRLFLLTAMPLATALLAACRQIGEMAASMEGVGAGDPAAAELPVGEETGQTDFPIEVTYFTPSQAEGPFYPVEKPQDRDSDLLVLGGASGRPAGAILEFGGSLYDATGMPVPAAVIEIWQTDDNGIYLHPGDRDLARRDINFQSYGESVTAEDGTYRFRTIMPGSYSSRPRHIHVKVRFEGRELLTTQFYFDNDPEMAGDRVVASAGDALPALIMEVTEGIDAEGNAILIGRRDIVLSSVPAG